MSPEQIVLRMLDEVRDMITEQTTSDAAEVPG